MNSNKILFKRESFLNGRSKQKFINELISLLQDQVIEAYIFGSFFTDEFNADSDIDILLISNSTKPFVERPMEFKQLFDLGAPIDILVYTEEEFAKLRLETETPFWRNVISNMKRII